MTIDQIKAAARYYLRSIGVTPTGIAVNGLMDRHSGNDIVRMAVERGYKI